MIIKCPQCSTGYSIPENMIGERPRKMRCSRCKNVFTIIRRKETAPTGYEEFTGSQQLPDEFAFLRESPPAAEQPQPAPPVRPQPVQPQPPVRPPAPKTPDGLYKAITDGPPMGLDTIPLEPPLVSGPTRDPDAPPPDVRAPAQPVAAEPPSTQPVAAEPPPAPAPPGPEPSAARRSAPSAVGDIYGGSASAWEMEAPLELAGYALGMEETASGGQFIGKLMTVIIVLIVAFFVFVAFRNGWSISIPDLRDQIAFAFSGAELEEFPDEVDDLEATIADRRIVIARDKTPYLVVTGEVVNNSPVLKANVILRGRLLDPAGDIRGEVRAPCGKVAEDSVIEALEAGSAPGLYRQGGELYNCQLSGSGSTVFQIIFDDMPADYDGSFQVEIRPVAAVVPS
jgi:predicted Zn finger-like uncharacterized protein